MFDFVNIKSKRDDKKKTISVYPSFLVRKSKDLMTKGKSFYAIWDEEVGLWSTEETRLCELIDKEIDIKADELREARPYIKIMVSTNIFLEHILVQVFQVL